MLINDANVITGDLELSGVDFTALLNTLVITNHRLAVPEVVLAEAVNNYRRVLGEAVTSIRRPVRSS